MATASACKIEFIPTGGAAVVLVTVGDWLAKLPRFEGAQGLFELDGIDSGESYFKPLGGAVVTITFTKETDLPIKAARAAWLDAELAAGVDLLRTEGALVITGESSVATYAPAVVADVRPTLSTPETPEAVTYEIRAALPEISTL